MRRSLRKEICELTKKKPPRGDFFFCCGGRDRTTDLQVMSLTSYHCSTPRYNHFSSKCGAKVLLFFDMSKYFCKKMNNIRF